jgi:hypothetical protein
VRTAAAVLTAASLALTACGDGGASAPGEVSEGEAKALEDAASMLDERRLPPDALPPEAQAPAADPEEMTGDTAAPSGE